jgi:vancomycin permeability regulator SanA
MDTKYILPLTKSPHARGRFGARKLQDYYRGLEIAVKELKANPEAKILVLSAFQQKGDLPEREIYKNCLLELKVPEERILVDVSGYETIGQIERMRKLVDEGSSVVIVSTFMHYPRVRWLCRSLPRVSHRIAWGIPRPSELVTDIILNVAFPILDVCGLRTWFVHKVTARRQGGTF